MIFTLIDFIYIHFFSTISLLPRTKFYIRPEENKIISKLSLADKINTTSWGGLQVKVNPRPSARKLMEPVGNPSTRTEPYMSGNAIEEEEFDISESDSDDSFK